jgi:hypothetical protein
MPISTSIIDKVLQFTKTYQTKKAQSQAQQHSTHLNSHHGLILLPVLAQPNGSPSRFREEFEPLLLKEKEKPLTLFPVLLSVSPQSKESQAPRKADFFHSQFSQRRRQRLEAGLEIRVFSCESSSSTMDSLVTLVPDYNKPLPALPLPDYDKPLPALPLSDYDKPLPPIPEVEEEFAFFFDTICRNCGEEGNMEKGSSGQEFEMWVDTEDCGCCRDGSDGEVGAAGADIREADIML